MAGQRNRNELWIQGMMIEESGKKLENALNCMDGILEAKVNFDQGNVIFTYDPAKVKSKMVKKVIGDLGMSASETSPAPAAPKPRQARAYPGIVVPPDGENRGSGNHAGALVHKALKISGMTCTSCEMRIENRLKKTRGVREAKVSYAAGTAKVAYDPSVITLNEIIAIIEKLDYQVLNNPRKKAAANGQQTKPDEKTPINQLIGVGIIILAGYLIIKNTIGFNFIPNINQNTGYGILFVVGLITSLHCVAMCGGINLSQAISRGQSAHRQGAHGQDAGTSKLAALKPSLLYNAGRVISYTVLGGMVGALGSVFSFSGTAKGIVSILAGVFMVVMGLNMLNIFPWLRRFMPHMPKAFARKFHSSGQHGPLIVGLFNGLMPCGPLQAMQIYALGTGSFAKGALSMFLFSLGTVPLMFGFGAVSSLLSSKFTRKMMKVSAALVMILGIVMLNRGFVLSGFNPAAALAPKADGSGNVATIQGGTQTVTTTLESNSYAPITVQKGIPVKWTIKADASTINGCNQTVTIPQLNISKTLQAGVNEIDFTPQQTGTITYTCSMGMITSTISVVSDVANDVPATVASQPSASTGSASNSDIGVAKISGNEQEVTVTVGAGGYTPNILVLQKGVPAKIKFNTGTLTSCNSYVVFPELNSQLDLNSQKETPVFTPQSNLSFECGMGMLRGYAVVVDDLNHIDLNAIRQQAQNYVSSGGGMACCQ